jgi:hypothetical protein
MPYSNKKRAIQICIRGDRNTDTSRFFFRAFFSGLHFASGQNGRRGGCLGEAADHGRIFGTIRALSQSSAVNAGPFSFKHRNHNAPLSLAKSVPGDSRANLHIDVCGCIYCLTALPQHALHPTVHSITLQESIVLVTSELQFINQLYK